MLRLSCGALCFGMLGAPKSQVSSVTFFDKWSRTVGEIGSLGESMRHQSFPSNIYFPKKYQSRDFFRTSVSFRPTGGFKGGVFTAPRRQQISLSRGCALVAVGSTEALESEDLGAARHPGGGGFWDGCL